LGRIDGNKFPTFFVIDAAPVNPVLSAADDHVVKFSVFLAKDDQGRRTVSGLDNSVAVVKLVDQNGPLRG